LVVLAVLLAIGGVLTSMKPTGQHFLAQKDVRGLHCMCSVLVVCGVCDV
jgi:hypothetical protein